MIFRGTYNIISNDAQIFIMLDNMDYYINLSNSANQAAIWKYSTLSNQYVCYDFSQITRSFYGSLMLGNDQLFLTGRDASTTTLFHMYMINFSSYSYSWAKTISCSTNCSNYLKKKAFRAATIQKYTVCFPLNLVQMHTSSHWTRQTEVLLVRDTSQASVEVPRLDQQGMETIWCFQ